MKDVVRYSDLRVGDVVFNGNTPAFLVLECDVTKNVFRWFSLLDGTTGQPNFNKSEMWRESLDTYSYVLRGDKKIQCSRYWTLD